MGFIASSLIMWVYFNPGLRRVSNYFTRLGQIGEADPETEIRPTMSDGFFEDLVRSPDAIKRMAANFERSPKFAAMFERLTLTAALSAACRASWIQSCGYSCRRN